LNIKASKQSTRLKNEENREEAKKVPGLMQRIKELEEEAKKVPGLLQRIKNLEEV